MTIEEAKKDLMNGRDVVLTVSKWKDGKPDSCTFKASCYIEDQFDSETAAILGHQKYLDEYTFSRA